MRKIKASQIICFFSLLSIIIILSLITAKGLLGGLSLGDFRGVILFLSVVFFIYFYAICVYRVFLHFMPLKEGVINEDSPEEFVAQVNILFYLILFNSLIRTYFIPIPIQRNIYLALGARLGENTFSAGVILDPPLTYIGDNSIVGHDAVLFSHAIEGGSFSLEAIRIGHNVTIGAKAIIMSGARIGDGAIVSAAAVVTKGTIIGPDEIWGGIPARFIKKK